MPLLQLTQCARLAWYRTKQLWWSAQHPVVRTPSPCSLFLLLASFHYVFFGLFTASAIAKTSELPSYKQGRGVDVAGQRVFIK